MHRTIDNALTFDKVHNQQKAFKKQNKYFFA